MRKRKKDFSSRGKEKTAKQSWITSILKLIKLLKIKQANSKIETFLTTGLWKDVDGSGYLTKVIDRE
jgi:hypothetical protein